MIIRNFVEWKLYVCQWNHYAVAEDESHIPNTNMSKYLSKMNSFPSISDRNNQNYWEEKKTGMKPNHQWNLMTNESGEMFAWATYACGIPKGISQWFREYFASSNVARMHSTYLTQCAYVAENQSPNERKQFLCFRRAIVRMNTTETLWHSARIQSDTFLWSCVQLRYFIEWNRFGHKWARACVRVFVSEGRFAA